MGYASKQLEVFQAVVDRLLGFAAWRLWTVRE
jgi:hypothetical protein